MMPAVTGVLHIVATPIGNLEDLSPRARRVLSEVAWVACEDTRVSRKLLSHYGIGTPTLSHHAHSGDGATDRLVARLVAGEDGALISDAGTPLVSDPGASLVERAVAAGVELRVVPGPSAVVAALSTSGVPAGRFAFLGFLPRRGEERRALLAAFREVPAALVLFEAPGRVAATLEDLRAALGDRAACVARELTKKFESYERGVLSELAPRFAEGTRGEIVIVVAGADAGGATERRADTVEADARALLAAGQRPGDVAKALAAAHGLPRREAYQLVLELSAEGGEAE
jgi:16S rRNA (cytidine1402-2'-O)-methyltransferase